MAGETRINQIEGLQEYLDRATPDSYATLPVSNNSVSIDLSKSHLFQRYDLTNLTSQALTIETINSQQEPGTTAVIMITHDGYGEVQVSDVVTVGDSFRVLKDGEVSVLLLIGTYDTDDNIAIWLNPYPKHEITMGTGNASGGKSGDIHYKYE